MFEKYTYILDEDKQKLKSFLELLDAYLKRDEEIDSIKNELINFSTNELSHIFEFAKNNPELQLEIWRVLPNEIVDNPENFKIFERVLENKFGEYLQEVDKRNLVKLLNSSREVYRSYG